MRKSLRYTFCFSPEVRQMLVDIQAFFEKQGKRLSLSKIVARSIEETWKKTFSSGKTFSEEDVLCEFYVSGQRVASQILKQLPEKGRIFRWDGRSWRVSGATHLGSGAVVHLEPLN